VTLYLGYNLTILCQHFLLHSALFYRDRGGPNGGQTGPPGGFRRDDRDMHAPQGIRNRGYSIGTFLLLLFVSVLCTVLSDLQCFRQFGLPCTVQRFDYLVQNRLHFVYYLLSLDCVLLLFDCERCVHPRVFLGSTDRNGQNFSVTYRPGISF
jgi:hypothetical protein